MGVSLKGFTQSDKKLTGKVTDSTGTGIENVVIIAVDNKDSIKLRSGKEGRFSFPNIKSDSVTLIVAVLNYETYTRQYIFGRNKQLDIQEVRLKPVYHDLKEVIVKSTPVPVKIMQDTVEFNAAAFTVIEGDNVADLIKQFQGVEVDDEYNVTFKGENVVKLRVNGKDFFTNNVQEFIAKLPAEIVSKIQMIDDYGDMANFTGVKLGKPRKMLNIVTKPGMNKGKFGMMGIKAGTNRQIGTDNNVNLWRGDNQIGATVNYGIQDNGAGSAEKASIRSSYRNQLGKKGSISFSYGLNKNNSDFTREQLVETVSSLGTYYNASKNNGKANSFQHSFNSEFYTGTRSFFMGGTITGSYATNNTGNNSLNRQTGVARQDFNNLSSNGSETPNMEGAFNFSKRIGKAGNALSGNLGFSLSENRSDQLITTNTIYYDQQQDTVLKDSLLQRTINAGNISRSVSLGLGYTIPLSKATEGRGTKSIILGYSASISGNNNNSATYVLDNQLTRYHFVDSLSTEFTSLMISQSVSVNYNYVGKKLSYTAGINARPVVLDNDYKNLNSKIRNTTLNYSPTMNLRTQLGEGKALSINYNGSNSSPSPAQLQPVRNTQNLQNIVIGNPDLKPYFQHSLQGDYNQMISKSGASFLASGSLSTTQNEIVQNVVVIPDTLGSYRQETRYENTNGTYNANAHYNVSVPFKDNKLSVGYGGSFGISKRALFINNERYLNSGLNFSQELNAGIRSKQLNYEAKVSYSQASNNNIVGLMNGAGLSEPGGMPSIPNVLNPGQFATANFFTTRTVNANIGGRYQQAVFGIQTRVNYSYSSNTNSEVKDGSRDLQTWALSCTGNAAIKKRFRVTVNASKRINSGYAIANQNPFLLGFSVSGYMLKNKELSLTASGSDLLAQSNMINRTVSGNSIVDSRSNVVTRVFSLQLSYNLSRFGAGSRHIRVDPD